MTDKTLAYEKAQSGTFDADILGLPHLSYGQEKLLGILSSDPHAGIRNGKRDIDLIRCNGPVPYIKTDASFICVFDRILKKIV